MLLDKVAKRWRTSTTMVTDKSHLSNGAAEKAISTVRGLARTYFAVLKDNIASFDVQPDSPMLPWTITHAALVVTRYNERRDTSRDTM